MTGNGHHSWDTMPRLIEEVLDVGQRLSMPFVAAQSDLGDPDPMADANGVPYAETCFQWIDPDHRYWRDRKLALNQPFLAAARLIAEPLYYTTGQLRSWRPTSALDAIDCQYVADRNLLSEAVIAPVHLPRGVVGAVVWCSAEPVGIAEKFHDLADRIHGVAYRLLSTHAEAKRQRRPVTPPQTLTRREVQCLRWAAAGKTDSEIGIILSLSVSTVRFHLRNAGGKLSTSGRAQAIQAAAGYGFIGGRIA